MTRWITADNTTGKIFLTGRRQYQIHPEIERITRETHPEYSDIPDYSGHIPILMENPGSVEFLNKCRTAKKFTAVSKPLAQPGTCCICLNSLSGPVLKMSDFEFQQTRYF